MKQKKTVYGKVLKPLCIGERALLQNGEGPFLTSRVEHFIEHPNGDVEIITRNTYYTLKPAAEGTLDG